MIRNCGCVLSDRSFKECTFDESCLNCGKKFDNPEIISLNPFDSQV